MEYICYYTCPHCKNPTCGRQPLEECDEIFHARTSAEARKEFNSCKPCRHIKITRIEPYHLTWRET